MAEPFIGQITLFGGNFAPRGWAFCDGQLLSISQNTALFSILGTTFGGNGQTTFGLPDLRGRVPMHPGSGPGLSARFLGEQGGVESVTLLATQMPPHNHQLNASSTDATTPVPTNNVLAKANDPNTLNEINSFAATSNTNLSPGSIGQAGGGQPHSNVQPYTCINYIIALEGIYPSRN